jgi:hypothetical protein
MELSHQPDIDVELPFVHPSPGCVHLKIRSKMKHENIIWNPGTKNWFCTKCGRTSDLINFTDAQMELDQYECNLPASKISGAAPGTETIRLMRKPYKMTLRKERSGSRFVARTDEDKTVIELELFHDTVPALKPLSVGFELLSGTTLTQAKTLVDAMNERIVGIIVAPKE